jgi:putative transposase
MTNTSLSCAHVARKLDAVIAWRGNPSSLISDNGTELTSLAIHKWSQKATVGLHYIATDKLTQTSFIESFNGRLRDELLFTLARSCQEELAA